MSVPMEGWNLSPTGLEHLGIRFGELLRRGVRRNEHNTRFGCARRATVTSWLGLPDSIVRDRVGGSRCGPPEESGALYKGDWSFGG